MQMHDGNQLSLFFHSEEVEVATAAMQRLLNLLAKTQVN